MLNTNNLLLLMERASKSYIKKNMYKYTAKIEAITKDWRKWVRSQLSVRYIPGERNTGLYPMLRSGSLRKSLMTSKVKIIDIVNTGSGARSVLQVQVPISYKQLKDDYGEILNSGARFKGSSFTGWKDRIQDELESRLTRRLKGRL